MVIGLERGADLHMAQLMPLPLTVSCFSKIQIGFAFLYWLTRVVLDKGPLNGCVCVCVVRMHRWYSSSSQQLLHELTKLPVSKSGKLDSATLAVSSTISSVSWSGPSSDCLQARRVDNGKSCDTVRAVELGYKKPRFFSLKKL